MTNNKTGESDQEFERKHPWNYTIWKVFSPQRKGTRREKEGR
jgi:hypothetical protein